MVSANRRKWKNGLNAVCGYLDRWGGNRYTGGTKNPDRSRRDGIELVKVIKSIGGILDISHMDIQSVQGTFDHYSGEMIATHSNPVTLMKARESNRFLSDNVIIELAERGRVIGIVPYNLFLRQIGKKATPRKTYIDCLCRSDRVCCQLLVLPTM